MAVSPIEAIETRELVRTVNRVERPRRALTKMLFPQATHRTLTTEYVQIDELTGEDEMAPFVEVNGEAIAIGEDNGQSYMLDTPMISVKRALTAQKLLFERRAGQPIVFTPDGRDVAGENAVQQIADDTARLERTVNKREEWMIAQMLTGTISYSVPGGASLSVDLRKPAGNDFVAPNGIWATSGSPLVRQDIKVVKRLCNSNEVGGVTDAIGDSTAADALDSLIEGKVVVTDDAGSVFNPDTKLIAEYAEDGMRYIATIGGIRFWEYNATYKDDNTGAVTTYIRPGYFEFIPLTNTAQDDRTMFYGRIPDLKAMQEGLDVTERFSRVIEKEEPSVMINILKSRPLPWVYKMGNFISMKVTA